MKKRIKMKKIALLICIIAATGFAACKKDNTCNCTTDGGAATTNTSFTIHDTKSKAKSTCAGTSTTIPSGTLTLTKACSLS